jgi:hypothetical protein
VIDCPGARAFSAMKSGVIPGFDFHAIAPMCVIENPLLLGPQPTLTASPEMFCSVTIM